MYASGEIDHCAFIGNSSPNMGGAISIVSAEAGGPLINCSFYGNSASQGASIYIENTPVIMVNSIITNSLNGNAFTFAYNDPEDFEISYSNLFGNVNGDWVGELEVFEGINGNLNLDPQFVDAEENDLHLQAGSPCIDAGDPDSDDDPDGTRADMGAFYFSQVAVDEDSNGNILPRQLYLAQNYPNPFNSSTRIQFEVVSRQMITLEVVNILGQRVAVLTEGMVEPGLHNITFYGSDLPSGVYYYRLQSGDQSLTRKMLFIR